MEGPGLSTWQRGLWGLGTVFLQYAWTRLDQIAASQHWGDVNSTPAVQQAWALLRSCETALNVASLLNFLVFLKQGKYRQVRRSGKIDYGPDAGMHAVAAHVRYGMVKVCQQLYGMLWIYPPSIILLTLRLSGSAGVCLSEY